MKEICLSAEHFVEKNPIIFFNEHGKYETGENLNVKNCTRKKISEMRNNEFPHTLRVGKIGFSEGGASLFRAFAQSTEGRINQRLLEYSAGVCTPFSRRKSTLGKLLSRQFSFQESYPPARSIHYAAINFPRKMINNST